MSDLIYLASPYTHDDPAVMQRRYEDARAATAALLSRGELVYSPIVHSHTIAAAHELPTEHEFWMRHCIGMLERADRLYVLMLDGWRDSRGVREEIDWWEAHRASGLRYLAVEGALT